jgi:hypothetical protein
MIKIVFSMISNSVMRILLVLIIYLDLKEITIIITKIKITKKTVYDLLIF